MKTIMKRVLSYVLALVLFLSCFSFLSSAYTGNETLKGAYIGAFPMGVAVSAFQVEDDKEASFIKKHFNSIVAENEMKMHMLQPKEGEFNFGPADKLVNFAVENNMLIRGHTLIWHESIPDWFCKNTDGTEVSKEVLLQRMETHIKTVVSRYKGKVYCWDVVNEPIAYGEATYRDSPFYRIIGPEFINYAFKWAREADPNCKLFLNETGVDSTSQFYKIRDLMTRLVKEGVPVDGFGIQGHYDIKTFDKVSFQRSIDAFSALGLEVQITELDLSYYSFEDKETKYISPPEASTKEFENQYKRIFRVLYRNREKITGVTFWGVDDAHTWLESYPIKRTDWPLLFDKDKNPKPIFYDLVRHNFRISVDKIKLNRKTVKIKLKNKKKKTFSLVKEITPFDASNKKVTWKSSNKKVAKVSKYGKVTLLKKGKATITATTKEGKKKAKCKFIVSK